MRRGWTEARDNWGGYTLNTQQVERGNGNSAYSTANSSSSFNSIRCAMFIIYFSFNFTLFHHWTVHPTLPLPPAPHVYPARGAFRQVDSFQSHRAISSLWFTVLTLTSSETRGQRWLLLVYTLPFHSICQAAELGFRPLFLYSPLIAQKGAIHLCVTGRCGLLQPHTVYMSIYSWSVSTAESICSCLSA